MVNVWSKQTCVGDIRDNGSNYMYSLMLDYEGYIRNFGFIPVKHFIEGWQCIPYNVFSNLGQGDMVYSPTGYQYVCKDMAFETDGPNGEETLAIEVAQVEQDGTISTHSEILTAGDLYASPVVHMDYIIKKTLKGKEEEKICPILITKTNQPQN